MDGPRPVRPEEFASLLALIDSTFEGYSGGMGAAFPLLFDYRNCQNLWVFEDKGRIVTHVGAHIAEFLIYGCRLRMASVGAVATYPEYRGRGLASQCLYAMQTQVTHEGAAVINISGDRDLYSRFNAAKVGRALVYMVSAGDAPAGLLVRRAAAGDIFAIERLYEREPVRYHRPLEDWRATFEAMSHDAPYRHQAIYLLGDEGAATGYVHVLYGTRRDEPYARVGEYAGYRAGIVAALPAIAKDLDLEAVELRVPEYDPSLRRAAEMTKLPSTTDFLTHHTIKIPALETFVRGIKPYIEERLGRSGAGAIAFQPGTGGSYDVIIGEDRTPFDIAAFTALAFGSPARAVDGVGEGLLERIFPVPLPLPGLNYV
jgi:predicted N-acetyltransferase YhbS